MELKDVQRKDVPLYYRKEFKAQAVFESFHGKFEKPVEFSIEHKPHGPIEVQVKILAEVDYPLIPVVQSLKRYVRDLEAGGRLS